MKLAIERDRPVQGIVGDADVILAQDVHARIRAIMTCWLEMGPGGRLPGRQHFDPLAVPRLLPNVWLVDVERAEGLRFRYRLAGTRIARAFRDDPTGRYLDEVHADFASNGVANSLSEVVERRLPSWRTGRPTFWELSDFAHIERIYLPLASDGRAVDMILALSVFLDRYGEEY